ncbi:MAG TPA: type II secretion system protein [Ramlibacter sp.]|nr:type II secretion system protein [Ramlibacter sp.]
MASPHPAPKVPRAVHGASTQRGFGYLLLLFALALSGVVLAGLGQTWTQATQREREAELLFIGREFSEALASYRDRTPAGRPVAPSSFDELLEDKRFPYPVRHLRRLYRDPMTRETEWGAVWAQGRIVAVHSLSRGQALREHLPDYVVPQVGSPDQDGYSGWHFVAWPESAAGGAKAAAKTR